MHAQEGTALDWRRWYGDRDAWPADTKNQFLADVVLRLAPMMIFPWEDRVATGAALASAPILPSPVEAFRDDGSPIDSIHEVWAPAILAYLPVAEYASDRLLRADPSLWAETHRPDPATGMPVLDPARAGIDEGVVTYDHWNNAAMKAAEVNDLRSAGATAMRHLARAVARMAVAGDLSFTARPIGGGDHVDLDPSDWNIDDPATRIASCAINIDARASTSAAPTHLMFVRPDGLDAALWVHAQKNQISLIEEGIRPSDVGVLGPKPSEVWKDLEDKALKAMRDYMMKKPTDFSRPALKAVITKAHHSISETTFEKARLRLRDEFPFIAEGGAPRGKERRAPVLHVVKKDAG